VRSSIIYDGLCENRNEDENESKTGQARFGHPRGHREGGGARRQAGEDRAVWLGGAGHHGPNSDYDVLVIKGGKFDFWRILTSIYRQLPGTAAVDVVLVRTEDAERYRDTHCLVICPVLREGKVIYDSQAVSAGKSTRVA
jgi:hypothetical protein